jgi:hypothetical protein
MDVGGFGMFEDIFLPGARHREEERNRLELTRDEDGEAEPDRGPIDLDSGGVVIRLPAAD